MKEEDELLRTVGTKNPFKVPEKYFENFTKDLMEKLPEKETAAAIKVTMWDRVKPWFYMAAMFAGLMLTFKMFQDISDRAQNKTENTFANIEASDISDQYFETITNDAMMDDYTLYQYLTDADLNY